MSELLTSEHAESWSQDVCDYCERVIKVSSRHLCVAMPIARVLEQDRYPSYSMLVSCHGAILTSVSDHDYHGDQRWLVRTPEGLFGIVISGFGSCSGCDVLQACVSPEDYDEIRKSLAPKWFKSPAECTAYLTGKDWETHHSFRVEESARFVKQCLEVLGAA